MVVIMKARPALTKGRGEKMNALGCISRWVLRNCPTARVGGGIPHEGVRPSVSAFNKDSSSQAVASFPRSFTYILNVSKCGFRAGLGDVRESW